MWYANRHVTLRCMAPGPRFFASSASSRRSERQAGESGFVRCGAPLDAKKKVYMSGSGHFRFTKLNVCKYIVEFVLHPDLFTDGVCVGVCGVCETKE